LTLIISGYWNTIILELKYCKCSLYRVDQKIVQISIYVEIVPENYLNSHITILAMTLPYGQWSKLLLDGGKLSWKVVNVCELIEKMNLTLNPFDVNRYSLMKTNLGTNCIQYTLGQCSKYIYIYFINIRTSTKTGKNGR